MKKNTQRKEVQNVTIDEHLKLCQDAISIEEYYYFEAKRVNKEWVELIKSQKMKCFYCNTDLIIIQQLIINKIINPRKRGKSGYSGLHFELDHKDADKKNNKKENLVASCYYCNNDKSNTFISEIFKNYFGKYKNEAFIKLFNDNKLISSCHYRHNLKGKEKLK